MNYKLITKIITILLTIISGFMAVPALLALYYGEYKAFQGFTITIFATLIVCGIVFYSFRNSKGDTMSTRDGFLFVTLSWVLVSLIGALPFIISGVLPSFADAYFETISGFTTTGASIITTSEALPNAIESLPKSILFWRSLTHWLGGMGIVVLTVAVLPLLGIGGLQLIKAEAPGPTVDKITPRIKETAKILWLIYVGFTVAETILLMLGGMDLFDALTHTFGTLATGGFSTKNLSVGHYNSAYIDAVITVFMVLAGINFVLHYRLLTGRVKFLLRDTEFKAYLLIFFTATLLMTFNLYGDYYKSLGESLRYASFQAATIMTTTGFASTNYELWPPLSQVVLFILMFIGGSSGSTGGGIKVIRIVTLLKQGFNEMKFLLHPRGIFTLRISGNTVRKNIVYAISGFFFLYIFMLLTVTIVVATSGQDLLTSFTTALATVGNVGPGFGNVGPSENYAMFPAYVKWFLSFAMLVGRLELYTVLIIFTPRFWGK
ncbi:MAG: TrkH family potassium uptake protein [bacterium]|nr:TrkH family potassium uptake protein [bacterium]